MKLELELQLPTGGASFKYSVIGSVLQDQSFEGNVLYKIDGSDPEAENKFWIGKDLRDCINQEQIRGLVTDKGDLLKLNLHKGIQELSTSIVFCDKGFQLFYDQSHSEPEHEYVMENIHNI